MIAQQIAMRRKGINITVTFQAALTDPLKVPSEDENKSLREQLYKRAAEECESITTAFKGDCQVASVRINNGVRRNLQLPNSVSATVSYRVTPPGE